MYTQPLFLVVSVSTVATSVLAGPVPAPAPVSGSSLALAPLVATNHNVTQTLQTSPMRLRLQHRLFDPADSFYSPPFDSYQNVKPGTYLTHRSVVVPKGYSASAIYQAVYRTEDILGKPDLGATTLFLPNTSRHDILVNYQVAEDSAYPYCAPSYATYTQQYDGTIQSFLENHFIMNVPDHEGYSAAFLSGIKEGKTTLDSIRAVQNLVHDKIFPDLSSFLSSNMSIALSGYSGGGHASAHAMALLPTYAPELSAAIKVLTMGGLPVNLENVYSKINKTPYAGLAAAGMAGLASVYPEYNQTIYNFLSDDGKQNLELIQLLCLGELVDFFQNIDIYTWFTDPAQVSNATTNVLQLNSIPTNTTPIPTFIYNAIEDEVAPIEDVQNFVTAQCQAGHPIYFRQDSIVNGTAHIKESDIQTNFIPNWLDQFFNGTIHINSCTNYHDAMASVH